jgi:hypothetical protein
MDPPPQPANKSITAGRGSAPVMSARATLGLVTAGREG